MHELVTARQGDSVDEWIVALWRVWPAPHVREGAIWEASVVYARVPTPDGDARGIERAHRIAELIRSSEFVSDSEPRGHARVHRARASGRAPGLRGSANRAGDGIR